MNYIINPSFFYWMSVCDDLKLFFGLMCFVTGAPVFFHWVVESSVKPKLCVLFAICLILCVFIPSQDTMIRILIARTATVENIGLTADTLQSAVDYIVQAIQSVK